jgi:outer membrane protein, heavy metal efflux system
MSHKKSASKMTRVASIRYRYGESMRHVAVLAALALAFSASAQSQVPTPLSYAQAIELATSHNLAVTAARRARAIREANVRTARQLPNPDLSVELTQDVPHQVVTLGVPVEIGGKRGRRIDLAREELSLADVDVRTALRTVRRDTRQAFYSLIAADERVRLADSILDITRRFRDAAQARFEAGAAPRLEVLQSELGVTRAQTDLDVARGARISAQATLNAVLNQPPQQALALTGSLTETVPAISYETVLAQAVQSNVQLVALDRQIAIEQRRLALLRAERVPTPVFSVSGLFNAPPEFTSAIGAGISLSLPIFSRNQGEIAQSIATTAQLRGERAATLRDVENSVFGVVARIDAQRQQLEAYEQRLVPTASDLEALAEESYRAGRTSVLGVLDAQRSLRDLRREALQAALDLQLLLADLEEILGTQLP